MKRILPIVFFLLYSCAEYNYEDCISGNCVNGLGSAQYEPKGDEAQYYRELTVTAGVYTGYFRDGLRHGSGDFVKPGYDGFTFNGEWKDDSPTGKGVYSSKSWNYDGEWLNGKFHGEGIYSSSEGESFEGTYNHGRKLKGYYIDDQGNTYDGEWKDGDNPWSFTGKVNIKESSTDSYVGDYKDGQRYGNGKWIFEDGSYDGEWKNGDFEGYGVYIWAGEWTGQRYEGEWKDSKRHGNATLYYRSGAKHVGEFENGNRHGKGKFYNSWGELITEGNWIDDEFQE